MSAEKTKEDLRADFIEAMKNTACYWANLPDLSERERCDGVIFSVMNILDGSGSFPCAIDLVLRPHPEDKQFSIDEGEDYILDGTVINDDVMLHEMLKEG
ncbi:TPA: hypothetical protein MW242_002910 [Acinetobacter baumannii]|nr:hypothetical protein [Acinetobacter baumannii]